MSTVKHGDGQTTVCYQEIRLQSVQFGPQIVGGRLQLHFSGYYENSVITHFFTRTQKCVCVVSLLHLLYIFLSISLLVLT